MQITISKQNTILLNYNNGITLELHQTTIEDSMHHIYMTIINKSNGVMLDLSLLNNGIGLIMA